MIKHNKATELFIIDEFDKNLKKMDRKKKSVNRDPLNQNVR